MFVVRVVIYTMSYIRMYIAYDQ